MIEAIEVEGLRELLTSLRVVDATAYETIKAILERAGDIVRDEARKLFTDYGDSLDKGATWGAAAEGFKTLARPTTASMPIVAVGQTHRRTSSQQLRRSNFGDLMMRHGLLPALAAKEAEVALILDEDLTASLRAAGL